MDRNLFISIIIFFMLCSGVSNLIGQELKGGKIIFEQIIDYKLEGVYDDPRWDSYIADLPKQGKSFHVLSFNTEQAIYEEDESQKEAISEHLMTALEKANYAKNPNPKVKKLYSDLSKQKSMKQLDFMTRTFLVEDDLGVKPWKLTAKKKKVMDYVCMGADIIEGEETITAWFTPEIPVSAGPAGYHGLPGMILGLEKNDEVFLLATGIELNMPKDDLASRLEKGQKMSQEKFDQVVEEKIKEYWEARKARDRSNAKSKKGK